MSIDHITESQPQGVLSEEVWSVPLQVGSDGSQSSTARPVQFGICLPEGFSTVGVTGQLLSGEEQLVSVQTEPLTRHPDGSIHWVLIDTILPAGLSTFSDLCIAVEKSEAGKFFDQQTDEQRFSGEVW